MAALTGNKIKDSYLGLLKSIDNSPFSPRASGTFVQISDGGGNALPLYLSTTSINFYNAYTFPSADGTISGQVLSTDANGTLSWITSSDNQTLEEVLTQGNTTTIAISSSADITTTAQFNGDINGALLQKVKAAEVLSKGDVVYISGGTGDNPEVSKANASDSTKMPALGIMKESLNNINDEGECITSGELTGLNLSSSGTIGDFDTGDELFVSSTTAGGLVDTAPTGEANLIQKIGKVIRGQNGGALTVLGAFRTNAMPNLPTGILLGDTTNVATAITDGSSGQILSTDGNGTYSFINDNAITSAVAPLNLSPNQISLGTVGVDKGGTGAITLTGILLGNGTSAISGIVSGLGSDGQVLTADGNGGYAFEVASGDVSISGTPTTNQVAIWTDGSTIKGMSALEIDTNDKITLDQDASSYNIGGGNIANVTGISNTGFGLDNLNAVTTGNRNVAFGYYSLKNLTIGTDNVAIGYAALQDVTEAIKCVAIGSEALSSVTTGHFNVAVGHTAGSYVSTSTRNTLVGYGSGSQLDTTGTPSGGYNTFIGYQSGGSVTTGTKNVILGSNDGSVYGQSSNHIIISDGDGNVRVYFDNNGQLSLFNEFFFRDSSAASSPIMFSITQAVYTASAPYNTNIFNARNSSNISFQTTGSTNALFIQGTTGDTTLSGKLSVSKSGADMIDLTRTGVGTYRLAISGSNAFSIFDVGANADRLTISSGGQVGINIAPSTTRTLLVKGIGTSSSTAPFQVNDGNNADILVIKDDKTATFSGDARFEGDLYPIKNNGFIYFGSNSTARIQHISSSNSLAINPNGGNVGIGTSSPAQKLVVGGGTNGRVRIKVDEGTNNFGKFDFSTSDSATSSATMIAEITANITDSNPNSLKSELSFSTNSGDSLNTALNISSGGNVGIGASPTAFRANDRQLQIKDATSLFQLDGISSSYLAYNAYYDGSWKRHKSGYVNMLRLGNDGNGISFLQSGTASANSAITFTEPLTISSGGSLLVKTNATSGIGNGDIGLDNGALRGGIIRARNAADNAYKALIYLDQNDAVQVGTAATGLNISSGGVVSIPNGIVFNNNTTGGTPNATGVTLNDYEEGTWTPTVLNANTNASTEGTYTRIGNIVRVGCLIIFGSQSNTTQFTIESFPFQVGTTNEGTRGGVSVAYSTSSTYYTIIMDNGYSQARAFGQGASGNPTLASLSGTRVYFGGTYQI